MRTAGPLGDKIQYAHVVVTDSLDIYRVDTIAIDELPPRGWMVLLSQCACHLWRQERLEIQQRREMTVYLLQQWADPSEI